jgi:hypothetical protein
MKELSLLVMLVKEFYGEAAGSPCYMRISKYCLKDPSFTVAELSPRRRLPLFSVNFLHEY